MSRFTSLAGVAVALSFGVAACGDGPKKAPIGGTCDSNGQCASGFCVDNACLDPDGDEDGDTLSNRIEVEVLATNPFDADSDHDGIADPDELTPGFLPKDTDGDGIQDALESATADADKDCLADQIDARNDIPDGTSSPDLARLCPAAVGVCAGGVLAVTCPERLDDPRCDLASVPGYEAVETTCDTLDNDCDGTTDTGCVAPVAECDALTGDQRTSGPHLIDPDGAGGADAFTVECLFGAERGGWTRLVAPMVQAVTSQGAKPRELFYGDAAAFFRSPVTRATWPGDGYREVTGLWIESTAESQSVFSCAGGQVGEAGIGCGTSGVDARVQARDFDGVIGTAEVCGPTVTAGDPESGCVADTPVWVRSRDCMIDAQSLVGDGELDALLAAADAAASPCWAFVGDAWLDGLAADASDVPPGGKAPALRVTADPESAVDARVLVQDETSFIAGRAYRLELWAKAAAPRTLRVVVRASGGVIVHSEEVSLTTSWQKLAVDFDVAVTVWAGQVELQLGGLASADAWVDAVRLIDAGPIACGECSLPNAQSACVAGQCQISACEDGYETCDDDETTGCETTLGTTSDCLDCDDDCALPHATVRCGALGCEATGCEDGYEACDDVASNGCETTLGTTSDCLDCDDACVYPRGIAACQPAGCALVDCEEGYAACDDLTSNGCETTLGTIDDCLDCDDACAFPRAVASCGAGGCAMGACDEGWGNCNPSTVDGCERSLRTTTDCGDCNVPCARAHATVSCATLTCEITTCDATWGNCNSADGSTDADGCEQTLTTLAHCGDCDAPCDIERGSGDCSTGVCEVDECEPDYGDCDERADTGCETYLVDDAMHCGECGKPCAAGYLCAGSQCIIDEVAVLGGGDELGCGVRVSGFVGCWGKNASGQLGDGTTASRTRAGAALLPLGEVVEIEGGTAHACARLADGSVRCWGANAAGQLGNGTNTATPVPVAVVDLGGLATDLSVRGNTSCVLRADQRVLCWGENDNGELGVGTTANANRPAVVTGITTATQVSIGNDHACALLADKTVRCWGYNAYGQLGNGSTTQSTSPVTVTSLSDAKAVTTGFRGSCAIRENGDTVVCWGAYGGATNATAFTTAGFGASASVVMLSEVETTCVRRNTGTIACMGRGTYGQLGNATFTDSMGVARDALRARDYAPLAGIRQLVAGAYHACVIDGEGTASCWGAGLGLGDGQLLTPLDRSAAVPVVGMSPADTTPCASDIGSALGDGVAVFAATGQLGHYALPACANVAGRERRFRWTAPASARYVVTTAGSSANTVLDVRVGDCTGNSLVCNDNTTGIGQQSRVAFDALQGDVYTIVADTNWEGSNASTNVVLSVNPEVCPADRADCNASAVDGCEIDVKGDRAHCGGCGNVCAFDEMCTGGVCVTDASQKPVAVAGGESFTCALTGAGSVSCWGVGTRGQLGGLSAGTAIATVAHAQPTLITSGAVQIDAGSSHVCARMSSGEVRCWGDNTTGQLGLGFGGYAVAPTTVPNLGGAIIDISAAGNATCALRADGRILCWGENDNGEGGNGTINASSRATEVTGITTAVDVVVGNDHTCARLADKTVRCWGYNAYGQLGNGTTTQSLVPVTVTNLNDAVSLEAGFRGTCAIREAGPTVCWGAYGGTTNSATITTVSFGGPVAELAVVMEYEATCARRVDGRVFCMGRNAYGTLGDAAFSDSMGVPREVLRVGDLAPIAGVTRLSAGGYHLCAIDDSQGVACWGSGYALGDGQIVDGFLDRWSAVPVVGMAPEVVSECATDLDATFGDPIEVITHDGQLGNYYQPTCTTASGRERRFRWVAPADGRVVVTTAGSSTNTVIEVRDGDCGGTAIACNDNTTGIGQQSRVVFDAFQGATYTILVDANWEGSNATTTTLLSITPETCPVDRSDCNGSTVDGCEIDVKTDRDNCGACGSTCAFDEVCTAGACSAGPSQKPVAVAGGESFTCALTAAGSVSCWGVGTRGQMGGTAIASVSHAQPTLITSGAVQIDAGTSHACARMSSGEVRCWGDNTTGQLGIGYGGYLLAPTTVPNLGGVIIDISAAGSATCALRADGHILCWGENNNGEGGNGTINAGNRPTEVSGITTAVDVVVGNDHTCARLADKTVRCWGYNAYGQLGNGTTTDSLVPVTVTNLNDAVSLEAGFRGTCAIREAGPTVCWGAYGGATNSATITTVSFGGPVAELAVVMEYEATCARRVDGRVFCMGRNAYGTLGDAAFSDSMGVPREVLRVGDLAPIAGVTRLSAGGYHLCAIDDSQGVACWGSGYALGDGQIVDGFLDRWTAVPVVGMAPEVVAECATDLDATFGDPIEVITHDGQLGNYYQPTCTTASGRERRFRWVAPADGRVVVTTAGSSTNTVLEVRDGDCGGTAIACNDNTTGIGQQSRVVFDAFQGATYTILVDANWEGSNATTTTLLSITPETCPVDRSDCNGSTVDGCEIDVKTDRDNCGACGSTCAFDEVCTAGACSAGPSQKPVAVAGGESFTCALTSAGSVSCWGVGTRGQMGGTAIASVSHAQPTLITSGAVQIDAGTSHACARMSSGEVRCWGDNTQGQLGIGYGGYVVAPTTVPNLGGVIIDISAAGSATCALRADGHILCWGENNNGEGGNGTINAGNRPTEVSGITTAVDVVVGNDHTCARLADKSVRCWGYNAYGQLGNGTTTDSLVPVTVTNLNDAVSLEAGFRGTCAIREAGPTVCWGAYGGATNSATITTVSFGGPVAELAVVMEYEATCARRVDGRVFCMGRNAYGTLGNATFTDSMGVVREVLRVGDLAPIAGVTRLSAGGYHQCAIDDSQGVVCWGSGYALGDGQIVDGFLDRWSAVPVVGMAPEVVSDCAVDFGPGLGSALGDPITTFTVDGQMGNYYQPSCTTASGRERRFRWVAPANARYVVTTGGSTTNTVIEVLAGDCAGASLGCNDNTTGLGQQSRVAFDASQGATYTILVDANWEGSNATTNAFVTLTPEACGSGRADCDGSTVDGCEVDTTSDRANCGGCGLACGYNQICTGGTCAASPGAAPVAATGGTAFGCALAGSGRVDCWGDDARGQLADGLILDRTSARASRISAGAVQISAGTNHVCARMLGGDVWCWGDNAAGQVGFGFGGLVATPTRVANLGGAAIDVSAAGNASCAVRADGHVLCWGENDNGEGGNGTTIASSRPTEVTGITTATAVVIGNDHACARLADKTVRCWGYNAYGQLGNGSTTQSLVPVTVTNLSDAGFLEAGMRGTCAVRESGPVACWGAWGGATSNSTLATVDFGGPVASLAMLGEIETTCARRSDGSVRCVGRGTYGQLGYAAFGDSMGTMRTVVAIEDAVALSGVTAVTAGDYNACALTGAGLRCWGYGWGLGDGQAVGGPMDRWAAVPVVAQAAIVDERALCLNGLDDDGDQASDCSDTDCATNLGSALGSGLVSYTVDGSRANTSQPSCTTAAGRDRRFTWTAPTTGAYIFSTQGSTSNTVLEVRPSCGGAAIVCNDNTTGLGQQSRVTLDAVSGTTYTVVIDSNWEGSNAATNVILAITGP